LRAVLQGHSGIVYGLAFTSDSRRLLSGSDDGTLRLWDVESTQCTRVLKGYADSLYDLAWSPDGTKLASAGAQSVVSIWEVASARRDRVLAGHRLPVYGLAWSPDDSLLASSGWDSDIRLWDPTSGTCVQILRVLDHPVALCYSLAWSPDGQQLACGTNLHGCRCGMWQRAPNAGRAISSLPGSVVWPGAQMGHSWPAGVMTATCMCGVPPMASCYSGWRGIMGLSRAWPGAPTALDWPQVAATRDRETLGSCSCGMRTAGRLCIPLWGIHV
jgi:WD40 repeat protein